LQSSAGAPQSHPPGWIAVTVDVDIRARVDRWQWISNGWRCSAEHISANPVFCAWMFDASCDRSVA
jgi:hypothetical protein